MVGFPPLVAVRGGGGVVYGSGFIAGNERLFGNDNPGYRDLSEPGRLVAGRGGRRGANPMPGG